MIYPDQLHAIPLYTLLVVCCLFLMLIVIRVYEVEKERVKVKTND